MMRTIIFNNTITLLRREFYKVHRFRSTLLSHIIAPLSYLILFAMGFTSAFHEFYYHGKKMLYITFLIPGLISYQIYMQFFHTYITTSNDMRFGVLKLLILGGINLNSLSMAKFILSLFFIFFQSLLFFSYYFIFIHEINFSFFILLKLLFAIIILLIPWILLGVSIGIKIRKEEYRDVLYTLFHFPIVFSSSIFYDPQMAPKWIFWISKINPLTYTTDILRGIFISQYNIVFSSLFGYGIFFIFTIFIFKYFSKTPNLPFRTR